MWWYGGLESEAMRVAVVACAALKGEEVKGMDCGVVARGMVVWFVIVWGQGVPTFAPFLWVWFPSGPFYSCCSV